MRSIFNLIVMLLTHRPFLNFMQGLSYRAIGVFQLLLMLPIGMLISICTGCKQFNSVRKALMHWQFFQATQLSNTINFCWATYYRKV